MTPPAVPEEIDPAKVHVLSVGIEAYNNEDFGTLDGLGDNAARLARWAVNAGVPAGNVSVAVRWLEPAAGEAVNQSLRALGVEVFDANLETLEKRITTAQRTQGDLLLLYWAGHGVLTAQSQRALFAANTDQVERYLLVEGIHSHLRAPTACRRQVMFFDACANFVRGTGIKGELRNALEEGGDLRVRQEMLFSAAQGAYSEQSKVVTRTTFSGILIPWLEAQTTPRIDFDAACLHISRQIEEAKADQAVRGFPVTHVIESAGGHRRQTGDLPVSGAEKLSIDRIELSVAQIREIQHAADEIGLDEDVFDDLLMSALAGVPVPSRSSTRSLVAEVIAAGRERHLLTEMKASLAPEDAQRLREVWRRHTSAARFLGPLGRITLEHQRAAFYRVMPGSPQMPPDLGCALAQARDFGEELLLRLVVALERETGRPLPYAAFGDLADEPMVQRVRAELPEVSADNAVLLVSLPDNAAGTWPATVSCFVRLPNAEFKPAADVACSPTEAGVRAAVRSQFQQLRAQVPRSQISVGFLVPRRVMEASIPEAWDLGDGPVWSQWPTRLHFAERQGQPHWSAAWQEACQRIDQAIEGLLRWGWIGEPQGIDDTEYRQSAIHCVALRGIARTRGLPDSLRHTVELGAPYILWTHQPPDDIAATAEFFDSLILTGGAFAEIPRRLADARRRGHDVATNTRLIWDSPESVPAHLTMTGMLSAG